MHGTDLPSISDVEVKYNSSRWNYITIELNLPLDFGMAKFCFKIMPVPMVAET
jgi:hypothetical protein